MKCRKVKNPCKICFESVSKKNGIQCQGACQKWAHFKCLNYTPGKIQDIKAGLIEVTCPCPDCNTGQPKEKLVNPPFTCTNTECPANKLPVCKSVECPSNDNPIPTYQPPPFEYSPASSPQRSSSPLCPKKCTVDKTSSPPNLKTKRKQSSKCDRHTANQSTSASPVRKNPQKYSAPCPTFCPSHQLLSKPRNKTCSPKQSKSCSNLSNSSSFRGKKVDYMSSIYCN